jgi:2-oxoglutarate dehydrogenase E2 component (dihydrolipoamide succinyltransferase)
MAVSVTMPRLGESVSEGTVTRWLKQEGEQVEADEPLLEVSTDKVDTEIPSPPPGVSSSIKVQEDETVEVGVELATIDDGAGGGDAAARAAEPEPEARQSRSPSRSPSRRPSRSPSRAGGQGGARAGAEAEPEQPAPQQRPSRSARAVVGGRPSGGEGAYVTPLVRKLAAEHGVDLSSLQGTGVGGRIRKQDVLDAAGQSGGGRREQDPPRAAGSRRTPPGAGRPQLEKPGEQKASAPAPAFVDQAVKAAPDTTVRGKTEPMSGCARSSRSGWSSRCRSAPSSPPSSRSTSPDRPAARTGQGVLRAARGREAQLHAVLRAGDARGAQGAPGRQRQRRPGRRTITYHDGVHLGIAVDTERGLLVPVVHGAGDLNLAGLAKKIADLAERTRANKVTPDELGGGTFTLTNTGSRGALFDTPIINQPQVGVLGTGAVVKRPSSSTTPTSARSSPSARWSTWR